MSDLTKSDLAKVGALLVLDDRRPFDQHFTYGSPEETGGPYRGDDG